MGPVEGITTGKMLGFFALTYMGIVKKRCHEI